jgi:anti-sigma regulatory factor (Ser/Thr protein kinase)
VPHLLRAALVTNEDALMHPARAGSGGNGETMLDQEFGVTSLSALRQAVMGCAAAAGMNRDRSIDVMIAMHELAANVVRHGAGRGRLRMEVTASALRCQVSDAGQVDSPVPGPRGETPPATTWPVEHGHGLWLVRRTADQVQVTTDSAGSVVSVIFVLPGE